MKTVRKLPFGEIFRTEIEPGEEVVKESLTCLLCGHSFSSSGLVEKVIRSGMCPNCGGSNENPLTGKV